MLSIAYYFLQVIVCSAVMMGYYWLVLRNKRFHQYNRFYLLAVALLSWIVPLIKIQWSKPLAYNQDMMRWLYVVADSNSEMEETVQNKGFLWNWDTAAAVLYVAVAGMLLLLTIRTVIRLYRLLKTHSCRHVEDVYLILTQAKGTPFSFFRYIFWNEAIDLRSESGKQILQHELTHVRQKHSVDKLFVQLMLAAGWFNPFFWLLRREMDMIHEFIADKKAVVNGDTASLAQMLLTAAYPQQQFVLTNPFFFSPIKRRLQMLTNNRNPRFTYVRRLVVLPLLAVVVVLFAFRNKERHQLISVGTVMENVVKTIVNDVSGTPVDVEEITPAAYKLNKRYTVVIDAGHGGQDHGARGVDGSIEKFVALEVAKKIKAMNANNSIRIVLTRDNDVYQTVAEKAQLANEQNPDLFISLHCNTAASTAPKGIELLIASKEKAKDYQANYKLANYMASSLEGLNQLRGIHANTKPVWILQEVNCPSLLIETGFMSNESDMAKLKDPAYQQKMAGAILSGIQAYLSAHENQTTLSSVDTAIEVKISDTAAHPLFVIDGEKMGRKGLKELELNPNEIASINVLKDQTASKKYGEEGKYGVVEIFTKKSMEKAAGSSNATFAQGETPAEFPGGVAGWKAYLIRNLNKDLLDNNGAPPGTYTVTVSFQVDENGSISNVKAENNPGYGTAEEAIRVIKKGPSWKPAMRDGQRISIAHREQIIFVKSEQKGTGTKRSTTDVISKKLDELKKDNEKSYFEIDGKSVIAAKNGTAAWIDDITDVVLVDGKRVSVNELNTAYKRSDFVTAAANDYSKKYQKGVLLLSTRMLSIKEIGEMMGTN